MPEKKPLPGIYDTFDVENPSVQTFEVRSPTAEEIERAKQVLQDLKTGKFSYFEVHKHDKEETEE